MLTKVGLGLWPSLQLTQAAPKHDPTSPANRRIDKKTKTRINPKLKGKSSQTPLRNVPPKSESELISDTSL